MSDVAVTNTFTNSTTADGNQVTTNFSDLVNYINARNTGSSTWDSLKVTSATAVPLVVNNSSGSSNIVNFQDNGSNVVTIPDGGGLTLATAAPSPPTANTIYKDNIIKCWINMNGTGTIALRGSLNCSGIVDNGDGDYTITWDRDFSNANYAVAGLSAAVAGTGPTVEINSLVAGSARIITRNINNEAAGDSATIALIAIGDQT